MNTPPPPIEWPPGVTPPSGEHHVLTLPWGRPLTTLTLNSRAHWAARARDTREVRQTVALLARSARLRPCTHVTVQLRWAPGDNRRRDADNLAPMLKSAADALARGRSDWVGLDLVQDDIPAYMTKMAPLIVPPPARGMWLDVWTFGPPWTAEGAA